MELIHLILDLLLPPLMTILLLLLLPLTLVYRFVINIRRMFTMEDLSGKVVLITGASSGVGEHLAYEYAKQGAKLSLVARRKRQLEGVANKARELGSPDVIIVCADVSKSEECKRFVKETVNHFGGLDHLVNNAGIISSFYLEESTDLSNIYPLMDVNFWGSVYPTHYALPHLQKSKGKVVVIASVAAWLCGPGISFYGASKAALMSFYETLQLEFGSSVNITIVSLGLIESEMSQGKQLTVQGTMKIDKEKTDAMGGICPVRSARACAEAIVKGARRGDRHVTDPSWFRIMYLFKVFVPEIVEWFLQWFLTAKKSELQCRHHSINEMKRSS